MPLYKVLLYSHAIQVMEGVDTQWSHLDANTPRITMTDIDDFIKEI